MTRTTPAKTSVTKTAPTKTAPTKTASKKTASAKAAGKKTAPAKAAPARAAPAKAGVRTAPAKAAPAKAAPAKAAVKAAPAKAAPGKAAAKKPAQPAVQKATPAKATAKKAAPAKAAVKKATPARAAAAPAAVQSLQPPAAAPTRASGPVTARSLKVREDESPWTAAELAEVRAALEADVARLGAEIVTAETELHELLRDSGDGAGDDQADAGAKTFEREQEISLANNSREMLEQSGHALAAIADGTYGVCESCGLPVGKMRLQAFPRATLCVSCKSRQERR